MSNRLVRGLLLGGLSLALVRCGADATKKVNDPGGDAGEAGQATASGGSSDVPVAGAPNNSGGMPAGEAGAESVAGGAGGVELGAGGMSGAPAAAGAPDQAGAPGAAGGPSCVPSSCCSGEEPLCNATWDDDCPSGTNYNCCDPTTGIAKSCGYGGGGVDFDAYVCVNDCTSKSYGTQSCTGCTNVADPGCDTAWDSDCSTKVYCSDPVAGYRLSCFDVGPYSTTVDVECLCDPAL